MVTLAEVPVHWQHSYRIIRSIYPPIDLFEDIADPADWEAIASAESKTNPRIWEHIGRLQLVPANRRAGGNGASYLMAPFVHVSTDRPGRFTDGSYGVYSAASSEEAAIREAAHHHALTMTSSAEAPGWTSQFRALTTPLNLDLHDARPHPQFHDPVDYPPSQALAQTLRANGSNGIVYNSVRSPGAECAAIFWPDLMTVPIQADHYDYHWDGTRVDRVRNCRTKQIFAL